MVDAHIAPSKKPSIWKYYVALAATASPLPFVWDPIFSKDWSLDNSAPLLLLAAYAASSVYFVQENEVAGIWVLQNRAWAIGPGVYLVPRGIAELNKLPTSSQQVQFPSEPENISKRRDDKGLQPGEYHPIRVTTKADASRDYNDDPLSKRLTLELTLSVLWKIRMRDNGFFETWERIPGESWAEMRDMIHRHMRDTAESQIVEEVSQLTTAELLNTFAALNKRLKKELQAEFDNWSIEIESCELQAPDVPVEVNEALANLAAEHARGVATVTKAQADSKAEVLRATGVAEGRERLAEARRAELAKEGEGMKQAADHIEMTGTDYYRGQIAKETVGKGDLILGGDLEGAMRTVVGLGRTIVKDKQPEPTDKEGAS